MNGNSTLAVNEIFLSFQGEGKNLGMPCYFLRLAGCNLACTFCDTSYTWDWSGKNGTKYDPKAEIHPMSVKDVFTRFKTMSQVSKVCNLVVSGGEPMLQQKALSVLIKLLHSDGWWIEIETAGTRPPIPDNLADQFTVSLKLGNSGNSIEKRRRPEAIRAFAQDNRSVFKFVACALDDFDEIDMLVQRFGLQPVYIMPEGKSDEAVTTHLQVISQAALQRGYHLTTRMQIQLYGNRRGV